MEIILNLIRRIFAKSDKAKFREKILNEKIDFNNVVSSSLLAKQIYDELKVLVHPDRFHDPETIAKATELFQLIHQNKGDYDQLLNLRERAYVELPIKKYSKLAD